MKRPYFLLIAPILLLAFLSSCVKAPTPVVQNGDVTTDPESKIESSLEINEGVVEDLNGNDKVKEYNSKELINSANRHMNNTFTSNAGKIIEINADIDVDGITAVDAYNYVLKPITDEFRNALFSALFGDRASEAQYDQPNDKWTVANSEAVGDYYLYETFYPNAGPTISGEECFTIEYRNVNLYPFTDNLLLSVHDSAAKISPEDAISMSDQVLGEFVDLKTYKVDYIHAYGTNGRHPYYKVVYKRLLDNVLLTGFNDIYFLIDSDGIQKVSGSVFHVEELPMEDQILSVDDAMERLKNNMIQINFEDDIITIGKITFEYIVVNTIEGIAIPVPAWRFLMGNSENEINLNRDKIIAVNAITGDIICDERGNTF